jgi:hypothetical protein
MAPEPGALQKLEFQTTESSVGTQALRPKAGPCGQNILARVHLNCVLR